MRDRGTRRREGPGGGLLTRRRLLGAGGAALLGGLASRPGRAETGEALDEPLPGEVVDPSGTHLRFFRIGTGSPAGTYYPVGGLLAAAISNPPGSYPCDQGGSCGVPGLLAVAQSTEGSIDNVERILAGKLESGLCQADIAYWAAKGEQAFAEQGPRDGLRVVTSLYPELLHLVARRGSGIRVLADLKGKRVSLDRANSGTRVDAELLLRAAGIRARDYEDLDLTAAKAAQAIREETLDAFFFVAGTPASVIASLAADGVIDLVPIAGEPVKALTEAHPFFLPDAITAGTYLSQQQTPTVSVRALWLVSAALDAGLVEQITAALWHPSTRALLDSGHMKARAIRLESALTGLSEPPLHAGALRFYEAAGLFDPPAEDEEGDGAGPAEPENGPLRPDIDEPSGD